jgi:hypothetical protein
MGASTGSIKAFGGSTPQDGVMRANVDGSNVTTLATANGKAPAALALTHHCRLTNVAPDSVETDPATLRGE